MKITFSALPNTYAITRLPADHSVPDWVNGPGLSSVTKADDEISIVCLAERAPKDADAGWTALRVDTLAALDEPGVIMAAVAPISSAGLAVFVISTHLRDYLLVRRYEIDKVKAVLNAAGHRFD